MTTRSSRAPDLPGASSSAARSVAPASNSATPLKTWPTPAAWTSGTGRFHVGQQGGRPAATAHHRVGHDAAIGHRQQVHVVGRVWHAVLGPAQRVLDDLTLSVAKRVTAQLVEVAGVGEPPGILGPDRL